MAGTYFSLSCSIVTTFSWLFSLENVGSVLNLKSASADNSLIEASYPSRFFKYYDRRFFEDVYFLEASKSSTFTIMRLLSQFSWSVRSFSFFFSLLGVLSLTVWWPILYVVSWLGGSLYLMLRVCSWIKEPVFFSFYLMMFWYSALIRLSPFLSTGSPSLCSL